MTLTATDKVPQVVIDKVRQALLQADKDSEGKKALEQLQFTRFLEVTPRDYQGLGRLLEDLWGY
jgi:ABC-type phosphate/phosphonate transport system substrate-binding protein